MKINPDSSPDILRHASMAYDIKGDKKLAVKYSILAIERDPENINSQLQRAIIIKLHDTLGNAVAHLQGFLKINPKADFAYRYLGEILYADGNATDGINYLKQAIKLSPNNADTHHSLGKLLLGPLFSIENIPSKHTLDCANEHLHAACRLTHWDDWEYVWYYCYSMVLRGRHKESNTIIDRVLSDDSLSEEGKNFWLEAKVGMEILKNNLSKKKNDD